MPATVEINVGSGFMEPILDMFQDQVEAMVMAAWTGAVSGSSSIGVEIRDSRYQEELKQGNVITRNNTVWTRESIFRGGEVAAMYENGVQPYDMKPGLLAGKNAKVGSHQIKISGFPVGLPSVYNTVPFRHGHHSEKETVHFQQMPEEIYGQVKTKFDESGEKPWIQSKSFDVHFDRKKGIKLTPEQEPKKPGFRGHKTVDLKHQAQQQTLTRGHYLKGTGDFHRQGKLIYPRQGVKAHNWKVKKYTWKTGKFEGMVKMTKKYDNATQNKYMTFRRVSTFSHANSWWHPGIPKKPIIDKLAEFTNQQMTVMWNELTNGLSQGVI